MTSAQLKNALVGTNPEEVTVRGIVDDEVPFKQPITYFEGDTIEEMIDDLYQTMDLNPPENMFVEAAGNTYQVY